MIRGNFKNGFLFGVFALALLSPSWVQAMTFDSIVVFGGSVSDSGNAFALTGESNRPPYDKLDAFLVPTGPYSTGGHHFSNGATWIEDLAKYLRLNRNRIPPSKDQARLRITTPSAARGQLTCRTLSICRSRLLLF